MAIRNSAWSYLRYFSRFPARSKTRSLRRGKRPSQRFIAQFDGGEGAARLPSAATDHSCGFDALEVRVMLTATPSPESDFYCDIETGTITSYYGNGGEVVIPATIRGVAVSGIAPYAFQGQPTLTSVAIPHGVKSIPDSAFSGCTNLTAVTLPASVTTIGAFAFSGCSSLTSVTIPLGVESIGDYAFSGCSGLTSVTIPQGVESIGGGAFSGCSGITSVTIPQGVAILGHNAFFLCSSLTSVTIPQGVTSLGWRAFCGCSNLTSITLPVGLTSIDDEAFSDCTSLTSITLPVGLKSIGWWTFHNCSSLTSITLPASISSVLSSSFPQSTSFIDILVQDGNSHYKSERGLLFTADGKTLVRCPVGKSGDIVLPTGLTSIGGGAFYGCDRLSSITLPAGLTHIGHEAFNGCTGLTSITLPASLTSLGSLSFWNCSNLKALLFLGNAPSSMGVSVFGRVPGTINYQGNTSGWSNPFFELPASDINTAPTAVSLIQTSVSIAENATTVTRLKLTDIIVSDDAFGTNYTTLTGSDASAFETVDGALYLKAGVVLNFEAQSSYSVTVRVSDSYLSGSSPVAATFTLAVTDVSEPLRTEAVQMPAGKAYKAGDVLRFTVVVSQPVVVTGKPTIPIVAGVGRKSAVYASGSGTNNLVFQYVVGRRDNAANIFVGNAIVLPTRRTMIRDASGMRLPLAIAGGVVPGASIDTMAPTVIGVKVTASRGNGLPTPLINVSIRYSIAVRFSESVIVSGLPGIPVRLDKGMFGNAVYVSGSGSQVLVFQSTRIAPAFFPLNKLPSLGASIALNGGSITDAAGNWARLTINRRLVRLEYNGRSVISR